MQSEITTIVKIIQHKSRVAFFLREIARRLEKRADIHDDSKFSLGEFEGFSRLDNARKYEYGSSEYEAIVHDNNAAQLHVSRNQHHPEYWPGGVDDMNMIDIIEMLCDWEVARQMRDTEENIDKTWQVRKKRFDLSENQLKFLRAIWEKLVA